MAAVRDVSLMGSAPSGARVVKTHTASTSDQLGAKSQSAFVLLTSEIWLNEGRPRQGDADVLSTQRWSQLREQERLEAINHSQQDNEAARELCSRVLDGGYQCDQGYLVWLHSQK